MFARVQPKMGLFSVENDLSMPEQAATSIFNCQTPIVERIRITNIESAGGGNDEVWNRFALIISD
jgi:hypothetical protein